MDQALHDAYEYMLLFEEQLKVHATTLRQNGKTSPDFLENDLTYSVTPQSINGIVCAVDASLLTHATHSVDVILIRSVAACFSYVDSKLISCTYHPSRIPETKIEIKTALDDHESMLWRSLIRLKSELSCALSTVRAVTPAILLIDGSLLPLVSDRPIATSVLIPLYQEVVTLYKELYLFCNDKKIYLVGVIKDSRGKRFIESTAPQLNCNDTTFLNYFLKEKERTGVISLSTDQSKNSVLRELTDHQLCLFYMKMSTRDRPLRIEFLNHQTDFNKIASLLYSLCAIHESYAYPAVLIEADLCALLDDKELERVKHSLHGLESVLPLRRNSRPFR